MNSLLRAGQLICVLVITLTVSRTAASEDASSTVALEEKIRAYCQARQENILREPAGLLDIPNVAGDIPKIERNAGYLSSMLRTRGIPAKLLRVGNSPPVVYGALSTLNTTRTVVFYAHYDGQPVDSAQRNTPPWSASLRDGKLEEGGTERGWASLPSSSGNWRIYARSASDDKAAIVGLLTAVDALREARIPLSVRVRFFLDGEEETGSPNLGRILSEYRDLLQSDLWVVCDGPLDSSGMKKVNYGNRGALELEMTLYGADRDLHGGHYGNWAPNPVVEMAALIAGIRDPDGKVRIYNFYDAVRPLSPTEKTALAQMPDSDPELRKNLGIARSEGAPQMLRERVLQPALNAISFHAGKLGPHPTMSIPSSAVASVDFRLVPDQTPESIKSIVEKHLQHQGYFIVYEAPDRHQRLSHPRIVQLKWGAGYPPQRSSMDTPIARAGARAVRDASAVTIIERPSVGGSSPMSLVTARLQTPVVGIPIAHYDNNQHAANENIRLQNLWEGIGIDANVLARLGSQRKRAPHKASYG